MAKNPNYQNMGFYCRKLGEPVDVSRWNELLELEFMKKRHWTV